MLKAIAWKGRNSFLLSLAIVMSMAPLILATALAGQVRLVPPPYPVPLEYFGMHFHRLATTTPWPDITFGNWRLWDAYVAWPALEPEKGKWNFATLDKYAAMAEQHHVHILLPLALSPKWASARPSEPCSNGPGAAAEPARIEDWREYVRTVASRYKGRIYYYEIWNEPNLKDFYTGSIEKLVELTNEADRELKAVDPLNKAISPSFVLRTGIPKLEEFLKAGGGRHAAAIGYHFYVAPNPPETMLDLVAQVRGLVAKYDRPDQPVWNTESGWAIENKRTEVKVGNSGMGRVLSESEAEAYVARADILLWAAGVYRFFYYSWDNKIMGLTEEDGKTLKKPAIAYAEVEKWLIGARMTSCESNADKTWVCILSRDGGYNGWIVWNPDRVQKFSVPREWDVRGMTDLHGSHREVSKKADVEIGPSPILLETRAR
jgi:hypothetical protein